MRPRQALGAAAGLISLLAAYLLLWPVRVEPVAFVPLAPTGLPTSRSLAGVERLARGLGQGPEDVAFDATGRLYAGYADGRIVRMTADGAEPQTAATTGGRPLGLRFGPDGRLYVCDALRGLLAVAPDGRIEVLAREQGGRPFGLADDLDVGPDGTVYFSDASSRFGVHQTVAVIVDRPDGRLLAYQPRSGTTRLLADGLYFANGVAVSPDAAFVLVVETGAYRVRRHWLAGPRAGRNDVFADGLPGFPDGILADGRGGYWVALFAPRDPTLDALHPYPWAKRALMRLPDWMRPKAKRHAWAMRLDARGRIVESLQDDAPACFAPVTNVVEHAGRLYLGSLEQDSIGRMRLPAS